MGRNRRMRQLITAGNAVKEDAIESWGFTEYHAQYDQINAETV